MEKDLGRVESFFFFFPRSGSEWGENAWIRKGRDVFLR